ncbi:hypothetical protein [Streptomyces sp. NPDC127103]|uniref:hypothetical protein n=1 Tax=Streptomyces sp. NPDC127103 TaxID=3347139 RepID=UPI00364EAA69
MNMRYGRNAFRAGAAITATCAAVLLAGCGAEEKPQSTDKPTAATSSAPQKGNGSQPSATAEEPTDPVAVLKGQNGFELAISSAERDAGGFLTVKGSLKNTSDRSRPVPATLRGDETELREHGTSLGGATLVDSVGKKRYYVLRDTDGRPLTTTNLGILKAGESMGVFMQFPAPPPTTTDVSFQLPTFEPATLKLS